MKCKLNTVTTCASSVMINCLPQGLQLVHLPADCACWVPHNIFAQCTDCNTKLLQQLRPHHIVSSVA